jgi:hypothetical protein
MSTQTKPFLSLQVSDLRENPVWQNIIDNEADEVSVFPVTQLPVSSLTGRIVGSPVRLANGQAFWAIILYLDAKNPRKSEQFVVLRIEKDGHWFDLARYWDLDYSTNGPVALSHFLGLPIDEVFPIAYDVTNHVEGERAALMGFVESEPRERLSEDEIIRLAVP